MLLPRALHGRILAGQVDLAFRAWLRPTVKAGGTLLTPIGLLGIDAVDEIDPASITDADAARAGAASAAEAIASLRRGDGRRVYRIAFHREGDDPRIAERERVALTDEEWRALDGRLARMDAGSPTGPWTAATLRAIAAHPAVVSTVLADEVGLPRPEFKVRVRRLKALGLTESLVTGYRLSPRGDALLARQRQAAQRP